MSNQKFTRHRSIRHLVHLACLTDLVISVIVQQARLLPVGRHDPHHLDSSIPQEFLRVTRVGDRLLLGHVEQSNMSQDAVKTNVKGPADNQSKHAADRVHGGSRTHWECP